MNRIRFDIILLPPIFIFCSLGLIVFYITKQPLLLVGVAILCIYTLVQAIRYFNADHPSTEYLLSDKTAFIKELRIISPLVLSKDTTDFYDNSWSVFSMGLQYAFQFHGDKVTFQKVLTHERALGFMPICWGVETKMEKRIKSLLTIYGQAL